MKRYSVTVNGVVYDVVVEEVAAGAAPVAAPAPVAGTVTSVTVSKGSAVQAGDVLVTLA